MQVEKEITSVSIIGAGNVGWHMALAMHQHGITVINIVSRNQTNAKELASLVSAKAASGPEQLVRVPDLCMLCVTDDALEDVVKTYTNAGTVVVHTSGSTGMEIFDSESSNTGVFYPLQTFTRGREMTYDRIPFLVEGATHTVTVRLMQLARKISGTAIETNAELRRKVHIAAVFACNFSNHMAAVANNMLKESGLDFSLLRPLLEETADKLQSMDPQDAQTGPAVRSDMKIVQSHITALKDRPDEAMLYKLLTNNIIRYINKENE